MNRAFCACRSFRLAASSIIFGDRSTAVIRPPSSRSQTSETATPCPHPTSRMRSPGATRRASTAHSSRFDALLARDEDHDRTRLIASASPFPQREHPITIMSPARRTAGSWTEISMGARAHQTPHSASRRLSSATRSARRAAPPGDRAPPLALTPQSRFRAQGPAPPNRTTTRPRRLTPGPCTDKQHSRPHFRRRAFSTSPIAGSSTRAAPRRAAASYAIRRERSARRSLDAPKLRPSSGRRSRKASAR